MFFSPPSLIKTKNERGGKGKKAVCGDSCVAAATAPRRLHSTAKLPAWNTETRDQPYRHPGETIPEITETFAVIPPFSPVHSAVFHSKPSAISPFPFLHGISRDSVESIVEGLDEASREMRRTWAECGTDPKSSHQVFTVAGASFTYSLVYRNETTRDKGSQGRSIYRYHLPPESKILRF